MNMISTTWAVLLLRDAEKYRASIKETLVKSQRSRGSYAMNIRATSLRPLSHPICVRWSFMGEHSCHTFLPSTKAERDNNRLCVIKISRNSRLPYRSHPFCFFITFCALRTTIEEVCAARRHIMISLRASNICQSVVEFRKHSGASKGRTLTKKGLLLACWYCNLDITKHDELI